MGTIALRIGDAPDWYQGARLERAVDNVPQALVERLHAARERYFAALAGSSLLIDAETEVWRAIGANYAPDDTEEAAHVADRLANSNAWIVTKEVDS